MSTRCFSEWYLKEGGVPEQIYAEENVLTI